MLIIVISTTNTIQDVFAQLPHETQIPFTDDENLTIYIHIFSKPFDNGTVEFDLGKYYGEQAYITDATGNTIVQFNLPPNIVSIGDSYHIAPYSSTHSLCGFSNGQNYPINECLDIYVGSSHVLLDDDDYCLIKSQTLALLCQCRPYISSLVI